MQTSLLTTDILVGALCLIKEITGASLYKMSFVNVEEAMLYFNLIILSVCSWYDFNISLQTGVAHTSTIVTFILLVSYHVYLMTRKNRPHGSGQEMDQYPLVPNQPPVVSCSVLELPDPHDQLPQPQTNYHNMNEIEVRELTASLVDPY